MFQFATPYLFLLLPLPWLVYSLLKPAKIAEQAALKVPFFERVAALQNEVHYPVTSYRKYLLYLGWLALITAAAGPQHLGSPIDLPRQGRNIMLALDISESMGEPDMILERKEVNRLTVVKFVARQFIKERQGDRLGLILFGTKAYLQTPLTFDTKTVENMLEDASIGLAGEQTAIGDAIGLAIKRLQHTPNSSRVLILLTDGANNAGVIDPINAAKLANSENIKIYTIGIGSTQRRALGFLGFQMINPSAGLDETSLKTIATITGGMFFRAKNTEDLQTVYRQIHQLEPTIQDKAVLRPVIELYYYPLALTLIISLFFVIRRLEVIPHLLRHSKYFTSNQP